MYLIGITGGTGCGKSTIVDKITMVPIVDLSMGLSLPESIFLPFFFKKICSKGIIRIIPKIIMSKNK